MYNVITIISKASNSLAIPSPINQAMDDERARHMDLNDFPNHCDISPFLAMI